MRDSAECRVTPLEDGWIPAELHLARNGLRCTEDSWGNFPDVMQLIADHGEQIDQINQAAAALDAMSDREDEDYRPTASILVFWGDRFLMRRDEPQGKTYDYLPQGGIKFAESVGAAALREFVEEFGAEMVQRILAVADFRGVHIEHLQNGANGVKLDGRTYPGKKYYYIAFDLRETVSLNIPGAEGSRFLTLGQYLDERSRIERMVRGGRGEEFGDPDPDWVESRTKNMEKVVSLFLSSDA